MLETFLRLGLFVFAIKISAQPVVVDYATTNTFTAAAAAANFSWTLDGVAKGLVNPGTAIAGGGAFLCKSNDLARFTRWQSAITNGGLWLQGCWRVAWQIDGIKIIGFADDKLDDSFHQPVWNRWRGESHQSAAAECAANVLPAAPALKRRF